MVRGTVYSKVKRNIDPPPVLRRVIKDYFLITIGCIIMALSLVWFLAPYRISAGGVSGISIVLNHVIGAPIGLTMLVLNIPLFIFGLKTLGRRFAIRTIYGSIMVSVLTDLIDRVVYGFLLDQDSYLLSDPDKVDVLKDIDPLLASIFGGVMLGVGLGLVFRAQGSTGGSDIIAQAASKYRRLTAGETFMVIDAIVISGGALVFGGIGYALLGFLALFISSRAVDVIVGGLGTAKGIYIISDSHDRIKKRLLKEIDRGVTVLHGEGGFTGKPKEVLFCVVTRRSIYKVRQIVLEEDQSSFMVIYDLHEVYGLGFKPQKEEDTLI